MCRLALLVLTTFASLGFAQEVAPPEATVPTNALSFNGQSAQGVQVASQALNVTGSLTLEAWVNIPAWTSRYQAIVTKGEAWGIARYDTTSKITFRSALGGAVNAYDDLVSTKDLPVGAWTHVAAVFTGTRKQLYIDGELVADSAYAKPLLTNAFPLMFGANAAAADRSLAGTMDSVRVWSVARTGEQIRNFRREYLRGSEPGLLGEWRFNEANGTVALDSSPAALHGSLQLGKLAGGGGVLPARVNGLALNAPSDGDLAVYFQNRTAQYPMLNAQPPVTALQYAQFPEPATGAFHFGGGLTAETWIYPEAIPLSGSVAVLSKGGDTWEIRYHHTAKVSFVTRGVATTVPGGDPEELINKSRVEPRKWTHVAAVWDPVAKEKRIYINGVLDSTHPAEGALAQNAAPLMAGARPPAAVPTNGFLGAVDEVRAWRIARASTEILANYLLRLNGSEPGLAGAWSFNEASGITSAEVSGRALPAQLEPGMSSFNRVEGIVTGAPQLASYTIEFNGVNQYATATPDPALSGLSNLTLEAWIKPAAAPTAGYAMIVQKGENGFGLAIDPTMKLRLIVGANLQNAPQSTGVVSTGVWSHVAVVVNGAANTTTFFINGKPAGSTNSAVIADSFGALAIGKRGGTSLVSFFNGGIDEVRIWNTARTPAEIILLAFGELPGATSGLVAHYSFTEGSGNSVADRANARTATLFNTNNASWRSGPIFPKAPTLPANLVLSQNPKAAGLWVGQITLNKVNEVQKAVNGAAEAVSATSDTASIRVILHVDAAGQVRLLKDVIAMQTQETGVPQPPPRPVLVTDPREIHNFEGVMTRGGKLVGMRYGTAAFDFPGFESTMIGGVGPGLGCAGRIDIDKLAPTNPYRHKYHPDHGEGFDIIRVFSIQFDGLPTDPVATGPSYGVDRLTGTYRESISGLHKINLKTEGIVILDRVSNVATLNKP